MKVLNLQAMRTILQTTSLQFKVLFNTSSFCNEKNSILKSEGTSHKDSLTSNCFVIVMVVIIGIYCYYLYKK